MKSDNVKKGMHSTTPLLYLMHWDLQKKKWTNR